ncbi:MAG: hypothetical protein J6Y82_05940 [Bacteroidales bacterium]|nr:hypothetical protein [Bacteroidales bacterium]
MFFAIAASVNCQLTIDRTAWQIKDSADLLYLTEIELNTSHTSGAWRDVVAPQSETDYGARVGGGAVVGDRLNLSGSFGYKYADRKKQCLSMLTFPNMFPFTVSDTIAGNQTAELYQVAGNVLFTAVPSRLVLGADVAFLASSTAKLRDLRNKNTFSQYCFSPSAKIIFDSFSVGLGWCYTPLAEEVLYSCFGSGNAFFADKIEGLWFGERIVYSAPDFMTRRHSGDESRYCLSVNYLTDNLHMRGELSYYDAEYRLKLRDSEKRIGDVEKNGWRAKFSTALSADRRHQFDAVYSVDNERSFVPIQQKQFSGTAYHYVQYGRVKRYSEKCVDFLDRYSYRTETLSANACVSVNNIEKNVYLFPQVFRQNVSRLTFDAEADYKISFFKHKCLKNIKLALQCGYSSASGTMLKRQNPSAIDPNYYCNRQALENQYNWLVSDYFKVAPRATFDIALGRSVLSLSAAYDASIADGASRSTISFATVLHFSKN